MNALREAVQNYLAMRRALGFRRKHPRIPVISKLG
jgi:hypothetical protein